MKQTIARVIRLFSLSILISSALAQSGSLDITFNPGSGANGLIYSIALQPDLKVLIGGNFTSVNDANRNHVARLNADGSLDMSFDPGDGPNLSVYSLALQGDGKILVGGNFFNVNGLSRNAIARLRSDGSLDTSFGSPLAGGDVRSVAIQTNGQVLIGGYLTLNATNLNIGRLNSSGSTDNTFNAGSVACYGVFAVALQSDGKVLAGGDFYCNGTNRNNLVRLNPNGSLDTNFTPGLIIATGTPYIRSLAVQDDGKILIGGHFVSIDGYTRQNIARLNADGGLDLTFNPPALGSDVYVYTLAAQADGKIIVGGSFSVLVGGVTRYSIVRLNGNGTLDTTFAATAETGSPSVRALAIQPDGKTLIGGNFTSVNGTNINRIARLNGDASPPTDLQFLAPNRYFGTLLTGTVSNSYRIEWTTDVNTQALWNPLFNVTLQTNPQFILDPAPVSGRQRFYRAVDLLSP